MLIYYIIFISLRQLYIFNSNKPDLLLVTSLYKYSDLGLILRVFAG